ncbi:unknown protein [Nostoc sp. NIES-3756]|uniref:hypothetical protein n=1 Tax=Nostoc sp. NIES-3756 TaxID=1751286 RepID=UPI0007222D54|nr:hypothetical protein [Nostoc sp. NIES-3756]BAT51387.1 unknown protein [Nostoc sp. NIES-3756]
MRLIDTIILTLVSTVICIPLPKLLSVILNKKKPQNIITESAHSTITDYIDVSPENGGWGVESRELENKRDVILASSGVEQNKK